MASGFTLESTKGLPSTVSHAHGFHTAVYTSAVAMQNVSSGVLEMSA